MNKLKHKKSQAWGIDLMIAFAIFTFAIIMFYFYALNEPREAKENIDSLFYDGNIIADSILSEGNPKDWNSENVITIGILTDGKIDDEKLEEFYELSSDYDRTKILFNTKYDYYFFLGEPMILDAGNIEGIGKAPEEYDNLVKITRFTVYDNEPVTAYLYIYEES